MLGRNRFAVGERVEILDPARKKFTAFTIDRIISEAGKDLEEAHNSYTVSLPYPGEGPRAVSKYSILRRKNIKQEACNMRSHQVNRLIKSEDLNHHGTLFAGRMAEWFVECAFIAAASLYKKPEGIVCLKIHGMHFTRPVQKGDIITLESKVVLTGNTSIQTYVKAKKNDEQDAYLEGFITFITVDEQGRKVPHNLPAREAETEEETGLAERALQMIQQAG